MPKLLEFADWAFGPDGLPKLDILAYGDFYHRGRRPNVLLCRSRDLKQITGEYGYHTCTQVAVSTGYQKGRQTMGSGSGEFRLFGGLSGRLFITSVVIAVGKRAVSMSEALFELKLPVLPQALGIGWGLIRSEHGPG
jgi:hypothetical protein